MANKPFVSGPAYITSATVVNIYSPGSGINARVRHIHLVNTDSSARTVTLYVDASGTGTPGKEILKDKSIAVGDTYDLYFPAGLLVQTTGYITGLASSANKVTVTITGDLEVA